VAAVFWNCASVQEGSNLKMIRLIQLQACPKKL
jgi:hypothetical protein